MGNQCPSNQRSISLNGCTCSAAAHTQHSVAWLGGVAGSVPCVWFLVKLLNIYFGCPWQKSDFEKMSAISYHGGDPCASHHHIIDYLAVYTLVIFWPLYNDKCIDLIE